MDLFNLRALTLWQPWADALVLGPKDVENRPWRLPRDQVGRWVLVHAGATWDQRRARGVLQQWGREEPATLPPRYQEALDLFGTFGGVELGDPQNRLTTYGAVIGAVRFSCCFRASLHPTTSDRVEIVAGGLPRVHHLADGSWWMPDQYGWVREDRIIFHTPVPCRGLQKLWRPTEGVLAACRAQLREASWTVTEGGPK